MFLVVLTPCVKPASCASERHGCGWEFDCGRRSRKTKKHTRKGEGERERRERARVGEGGVGLGGGNLKREKRDFGGASWEGLTSC